MKEILLAGATGALGRAVFRELVSRGFRVRRLVRRNAGPEDWLGDLRHADSLRSACSGVDAVISCAGASMNLHNWQDRVSFDEVDLHGNRNLLQEARRAGVEKFVYVSLAGGQRLVHTEYARAHEQFVGELTAAQMDWSIVRPTGLFSFFGDVLRMAQKGRGLVIGSGEARTNPIHEADAARACVQALRPGRLELCVGGPRIYTRREIVRATFMAIGRTVSVHSVPGWAAAPVPAVLRAFNPRIAALAEFGIAVSQTDCVAAKYGTETLERYFCELLERDAALARNNQLVHVPG